MPSFKKLSINDRDWMMEILKKEGTLSADYSFGNLFMWLGQKGIYATKSNDRLLMKFGTGWNTRFFFPVGSGPVEPAISLIREVAKKEGAPLRIESVTEESRELLNQAFPGEFEFFEKRDSFDYIYEAETFTEMRGKKLHAKRNFCNRFEKTYEWNFEQLEKRHLPHCLKILADWQAEMGTFTEGMKMEHSAIVRGFMCYEKLDFLGGVLRANGEIVAFTIGEKIRSDCFDIHFEKANSEIAGAYPMIAREFARLVVNKHPDIKLFNREEDMGIEGLRKAKESFYPLYLLKKYRARERKDD